ncbi:hypothetical protein [Burkholderia anthina]|uniref:hypothetical protein n=1 Tax=Burkholderia anthina TaxID=179879 RepID=UPI00158DC359|nr:hypothetical protein [Burkholderia anthina]
MNWDQDFTIVGAELLVGERSLGTFSSHTAAYVGLHVMRAGNNVHLSDEARVLTDDDLALLAAIDADEK